uniref:Uncharacterized protein n=1 Tax=Amphimedon queenslandica TaxID=400682 RepID=A0A1X7TIU9_AMPQE
MPNTTQLPTIQDDLLVGVIFGEFACGKKLMSFGFHLKNVVDESAAFESTGNNQDDVGQPPPANPPVSTFSHSADALHEKQELASKLPDTSFGFIKHDGPKVTLVDQNTKVSLPLATIDKAAPQLPVTREEFFHSLNGEGPQPPNACEASLHSPKNEAVLQPTITGEESLQSLYKNLPPPGPTVVGDNDNSPVPPPGHHIDDAKFSLSDGEEYCHISPLVKAQKLPIIFKNGLTVYFNKKPYHFDIAEAPFQVNPLKKLEPLVDTYEICIIENNSSDHVRCHDLRKKGPGVQYFIDEVYEPNEHIVALLLINSADNFTLDLQLELDNVIVNIPVYIISSVHGDKAIHLIEKSSSSGCLCKFTFSNNEVQDKPKQNYEPNTLVQHLHCHLFKKEKDEPVTSNISLFQFLTSVFVDEELAENIFSAVHELREKIHEVFDQEFLFLIVLVSELRRSYKNKAIDELYEDVQQYLFHLNIAKIVPIVNEFRQ